MNSLWIKVILVISLTINLLFIGAILGRISSGAHLSRPFPPHLGWVLHNLEPETRQSLKPQLIEHAKHSMPTRRRLREAQQRVNELILQDPLDKDSLAQGMEELRKYSTESQTEMHSALISIMSQLDLGQRKQVMHLLNRNWRAEMRKQRRGRSSAPL